MSGEQHGLIAFGGNLSQNEKTPRENILSAISLLAGEGLPVLCHSKLYSTPCFPAGAGPDYVNAAAVVTLRQHQTPDQVLAALHRIEARFGRERQSRWGARSLDLDLLAIDQMLLPDRATYLHWRDLPPADQRSATPDRLILPHPRMAERAFVLVPLADVAPDWRHPVSGLSVTQMLAALPLAERAEVVPLQDQT